MALRMLYLVAIRGIRLVNIARPRQAFKNAEIMVLRQEVMALRRQVPLLLKERLRQAGPEWTPRFWFLGDSLRTRFR